MGSKTNKAKSMNVINKLSPNSQNLKPLLKPTNVKEKSSKLNLSLLKKNSNLWLFNLKKPPVLLKVQTENTKKLLVNLKSLKVTSNVWLINPKNSKLQSLNPKPSFPTTTNN